MADDYPWLRLYHRIIDDEKVRLLAFEDRWHFVALLCLKRQGLLNEKPSEMRSRKVALKLGLSVRDSEEALRRIAEVGLTDKHGHPLAWDDLQFESDNSTARVRKYRERQKKNKGNGDETLHETFQERDGNDSVTPQETDTDKDTEEDKTTTSTPKGADTAAAPQVRIPYQAIVDAYHELLPQLPRVKVISKARQAHIRQRHHSIMEDKLELWREYFEYVGKSDFLMGRIDEKQWRADFDFLISERAAVGVYEGKYHGKR